VDDETNLNLGTSLKEGSVKKWAEKMNNGFVEAALVQLTAVQSDVNTDI
jgi:hypothetical protein